MNEEELLRRDNFLMSHGNLPHDTTTCETYGLSGNCGQKCPNFKNKTCEVYVDVLERENKKLKDVIDKAIKYINDNSWYFNDEDSGAMFCLEEEKEETFCNDLLNILKEVE